MSSSLDLDSLPEVRPLTKIWLAVQLGACALAGAALTGLAVVISELVFGGLGMR
jgi:hypothetical protein